MVGIEELQPKEGEDGTLDELNQFVDFRQKFHRDFDGTEHLQQLAGRLVVLSGRGSKD